MAILCSTAFIIIGFAVSYYLWGHDGLPFGWDTPHYIEESKIAASQGPLALIAMQGPYDFVYQLLSGLLVWFGIPALSLEIFLPITLSALFPYLVSRLALCNSDIRFSVFATIATPGWFVLYDLGASLHANLLGFVLILLAIPLLIRSNPIRERQSVAGLALVGIASFTHIETVLFFVTLFIVSSLVFSSFPLRTAILAAVVALPASILYMIHFLQLVSLTGYNLPVYSLEPVWFWLGIFGPLLPVAVYGLLVVLTGRNSSLGVLVLVWAISSLLVGVSQYFDPQTYTFAQRAAELVPIPLLVAFGLTRLRLSTNWHRIGRFSPSSVQRGVLGASLLLLLVSWPTMYWTSSYVNQRVFLTSPAYQRLEWINDNMKFANTPIFIFNDYDSVAGGYGDLYGNWVGAIVGTHLSYLGRIDYLVQVQQTPFSNSVSRLHSAIFAKELQGAGITNRTILLEHQIIIVEDFYNPFPLPSYIATYFDQVSDGIFVSNNQRLKSLDNVTLPLSSSLVNSVGPWYTDRSDWAQSIYALDVSVNSYMTSVEASFLLGISSNGTYTFSLRYLDGTGNNMRILLDGQALGNVTYGGSNAPSVRNFTSFYLSAGVHELSIRIDQNPQLPQFASLDYMSVARS